jgi:hypothetical protein
MNTYQSRWGFHPCNHAVYLKLNRIHKAYWEGLRLIAAWSRWQRKRPHNRVRFQWERDGGGRKIRRVMTGPWPEPVVPEVFWAICRGGYPVVEDYQNARHAQPEDQVRPLRIPVVVIESWMEELERLEEGQRGEHPL